MQKQTPPATAKPPSHLKDLLLLFSIPLAIALLAALAVYVPRLLAKPSYDFLYSYCESYDCAQTYSVNAAGQLAKTPSAGNDKYHFPEARLGYYDISADATRMVTFDDAQKYKLINSSKSPDGYSLTRNNNNGGFLFWGDYDNTWQLANGLKKRSVQLSGDNSYYSENITFLGWVQP